MNPKLTFLLALTFLFLFSGSSVVFCDDLKDAEDALKREDYETAYKLWLPLAEQGNAEVTCPPKTDPVAMLGFGSKPVDLGGVEWPEKDIHQNRLLVI